MLICVVNFILFTTLLILLWYRRNRIIFINSSSNRLTEDQKNNILSYFDYYSVVILVPKSLDENTINTIAAKEENFLNDNHSINQTKKFEKKLKTELFTPDDREDTKVRLSGIVWRSLYKIDIIPEASYFRNVVDI
ncbi:hypothetical protein A0H76_1015 [Hepatospora eriocheir]|uniref:Uncharacterized protein n=1 Tax=Hepatospora eriocheir TaxID=1081669 RepID=A0A1X0Q6B9_9MICR|nr:hypothetical protein A0H76_1015 [Hepatospora eriocheir]